MIYWFTGQPGSGKTTLATLLVEHFKTRGRRVEHIDGDGLRSLTQNFDYSEMGRRKNIETAQAIAKGMNDADKIVVVSVVAPYIDLREKFKELAPVVEFYLHSTEKRGKEAYWVEAYEPPQNNFTDIDTDASIEVCMHKILEVVVEVNRFAMFVGRYQPLHDGHKWLFDQRLKEGRRILICVRDMQVNDKNPFTAKEVQSKIIAEYKELHAKERVKVIIIPDIESVNYGRGVGYEIKEHIPPENIKKISATSIRNKM